MKGMPKKRKKQQVLARRKWRNRGIIPPFEIGDIQLRSVEPIHALQHKTLCDTSKESIGSFLGWAEDLHRWKLKDHIRWITSHRRIAEPFNSYGAFFNDRLLGFFNYSPANDHLGVQICYYVSDHCGGRGVATLVTETMVEKAFVFGKFEYVELHIDIANIASQRVAKKVGFEPVVDYTCPKSGTRGSGQMQVWVKINPKTKYGVTLDDFREGKYEYLAPAYQDLRTAYEATQTMAILIDKLKRAKLALAGKIPLSEVEDILAQYREDEAKD